MKLKTKFLKNETEIEKYIKEHKGRLTENKFLLSYTEAPERKGYMWYFEFDDGSLLFVMKNLNGKDGTLYYDKDVYIKDFIEMEEGNRRTPLDKHQDVIQNLSPHIQPLINELYAKLKLDNVPVKDVDLEKLDKAIKKYGYKKAYEDLFLNLIVFAGEYSETKVGGNWITEKSERNELVPVFVDGKSRKLKFDFWIEKDFKKYSRINMRVIIGTELHGPLPVYPNPTLRNPNEQ